MRMTATENLDALIIGAGPAGSSTAPMPAFGEPRGGGGTGGAGADDQGVQVFGGCHTPMFIAAKSI